MIKQGEINRKKKTNFIQNLKRHIILDTYLVNSHDQAGGCLKELVNIVPNGRNHPFMLLK